MRAIDADALRERLLVLRSNVTNVSIVGIFDICLSEVSNAPTIPLPDFKDGYKQAIIDGKINYSRPQGEWRTRTDTEWHFECNQCKGLSPWKAQFCGVCGADMRGVK